MILIEVCCDPECNFSLHFQNVRYAWKSPDPQFTNAKRAISYVQAANLC